VSSAVTPVFAERLLARVRTAGYVILALSALFPLLELVTSLWPTHFESATWRFGAAGLLSNYAMGGTIELFLLVVLALFSNQRRVLLVLGTICAILAVLLLGGSVMFVLDAVQTRAKVTPAVLHRFDVTAVGAFGKMVLFSLANGMLARGAFGGASGERSGVRARGMVAPIVVSQTGEKR
jgi:hypothetical protein